MNIDILPKEYLEHMKASLSEDYGAFLHCMQDPAVKALRFNPLKVRPETKEQLVRDWHLEPVPWCEEGWYYEEAVVRPGLSPYHDAGVFYIQEPSAMITAARADLHPDQLVLDLCAAPGGKSTQAAPYCGVLVSNEPVPGRARILSSNIERMGFGNTVVTSAWPEELAEACPGWFDRIMVDAPCSGEGMMRKDETAVREWTPSTAAMCAERQEKILEAAAVMLKPGGRLIYSTCTFEYIENEGQIRHFLDRHPSFRLMEMHMMYPHEIRGEGHFCAVLENTDAAIALGGGKRKGKEDLKDPAYCGKLLQKRKIHVLRAGVEKGEERTDARGRRFYIPSHAEALASRWEDCGGRLDLKDPALCMQYLHGESLTLHPEQEGTAYEVSEGDGWLTVFYDRYPLGWGKRSGNTVKNHYPKGLRRLT